MREIKFRAWLTLSDYDKDGNDKDYSGMADKISVYDSSTIGFGVDEGDAIFGEDVFQRAIENGTAYDFEGWCNWDGQFELMQYTGLKDKNGKEIYEGDILEYFRIKPGTENYYPDRTKRKAIKWEEYNRCVGYNMRPIIEEDDNYWEVIGNIYENPELLATQPPETIVGGSDE